MFVRIGAPNGQNLPPFSAGAQFELHYYTRSAVRMAFVERLQQAAFTDRVSLHWDGGAANQKPDLQPLLAKPEKDVHLYVCGTCLTRVLDGEPEHRDSFLTDAERARNDQMLPCCSRSKSKRLMLDI